ncbi:DUF1800 domain-containing protein [Anaerolineae bacterium CFX7]|nr:DUF1800 domain-containing protein [Anaerolineae bacterium CFX7]
MRAKRHNSGLTFFFMKRRQFLTLSGIAAASLALSACAPAREIVKRTRGGNEFVVTPRASAENWRVLERLTFAPRAQEVLRVNEIGRDAWLEEQLAPETLDDWECDSRTRGMDTLWMDADLALNVRTEGIKPELQGARVLRAVYSKRQLYENVVEFWSDHFSISIDKFDCLWLKGVDDREVIRKHAFGNFADLLWASMHSPAMLHYLDNQDNFAHAPNENYARELLELHSLGVDAGYTQRDVRETARALTGWTVNQGWRRGRFEFNAAQHDAGAKTILGAALAAGGGERDGEQVFHAILAHPALPRFIARKLTRRFVADAPPPALVERVAQTFTQTRGDIKAVLRAMFDADEFRNAPPKYKRPLDFVAGALRQLDAETNAGAPIQDALTRMGQPLFQWTTPDGFPDTTNAWKNNLLPRWQFALALATNELQGTRVAWENLAHVANDASFVGALQGFSTRLLGFELPKDVADELQAQWRNLDTDLILPSALALVLASPQYQWK